METQKGNKLVTDNAIALQKKNQSLSDKVKALQKEKEVLTDQVTRSFQTEQKLISKGQEFDEQYRFSRSFSELGKKINAASKKEGILKATAEFILYEINFERCLIFLCEEKNDFFNLHAMDGYYDDEIRQRMSTLSISREEPAISTLYSATDTEFILCAERCRQQDLLQLRSMFEMYEYVVFPLRPIGFLVAGNTEKQKKYQARIPSESKESKSEALLRIRNLVSQTTIALNNVVLKEDLETKNQEFKKLNKNLRAVNTVGQKLTSDISKNRSIEKLIHEQAGKVMNVDDMYICKYDEQTGMLKFILESREGKLRTKEQLPVSRWINLEDKTKGGLTEYVIRHKDPLSIDNVPEWCGENNITLPEKEPKSWLGVPMQLEGRLIGIIALFNFGQNAAYNEHDLEVLEIMAGYAAIAFENRGLYESLEEQNKQLEEANKKLEEAQEAIIEKEHLLASSLVAQDITHRLNNSLGSVSVNISQAREDIKKALSKQQTEHLKETANTVLSDAARVVDNLINEVKQVATTEPQVISVKEVISKLIQQVTVKNKLFSDNVSIYEDYSSADIKVKAPYRNLSNCLQAIVDNAGSALSAQLNAPILNEALYLKVAIKEENNFIQIDIIDNGVPIPDNMRNEIFERGMSSKKEVAGGYGLWRAKSLAHTLGGTLELLKSDPAIKAFRLLIPKFEECRKPLALVVEDERAWRNIISRWLEEEKFEVQTASTHQSALEMFSNSRPQLVMLDISLNPLDSNNVDGLSLIANARQLGDDVKLIILTGYKDHANSYQNDVDLIIEKVGNGQSLTKKSFLEQLGQLNIPSCA